MRIWLNPELMTARNLAAGEVVEALRANNLQIASGALNQQPVPTSGAFQLSVETVGRLLDPQQFADKIGRASCRERVCQYVEISVVAVSFKKKTKKHTTNESQDQLCI